jgi:cationic amino acid transporter 2
MSLAFYKFIHRLTRRKHIKEEDLEKTNLARVLSIIDLTALGVGGTLGAGAYVVSGQVAKADAGPAVVVSFFVAAVASILAGLCYAEFGSRVPRAGSAYIYTYVTVCEFCAFIIGWDLILEYSIGAASVARSASGYIDNLIGGDDPLETWFEKTMPITGISFLAPYFDLVALAIVMLVTIILAIGVRESALFTKIFTGMNLCVLSYIIIAGAFQDKSENWKIPASQVNADTVAGQCGNGQTCGNGGFNPYGVKGIMKGAATCFYAFVGFDSIATTGEEAKNPKRAIPIATIMSLAVVFLFYTGISVTITMMVPYYTLDVNAPFSIIFKDVGWTVSQYLVGIGAICALTTSLLGSMFPLPRVMLAMSRDGVLFRFLARVSPRTKTPVISTMLVGTLSAILAALFDTAALVNMLSIGTLLAYTLVSSSVLLLRYEADMLIDRPGINIKERDFDERSFFAKLFRPLPVATKFSGDAVKVLTFLLACWIVSFSCLLTFGGDYVFNGVTWAVVVGAIFLVLGIVTTIIIGIQPQNPNAKQLMFTVPAVPVFPALSMFFNIFLIVNLDIFTFYRFFIWMAIGFIIYFGYGMWHSSEEQHMKSQANVAAVIISTPTNVHHRKISPSEFENGIIVDKIPVYEFPIEEKL